MPSKLRNGKNLSNNLPPKRPFNDLLVDCPVAKISTVKQGDTNQVSTPNTTLNVDLQLSLSTIQKFDEKLSIMLSQLKRMGRYYR